MDILEKIMADLGGDVLVTSTQVFHNDTPYYPLAESYGSGKFVDGKLKAISFPVQHPSVTMENSPKMRRASAFLDLPGSVGTLYQRAAREKMVKEWGHYAPDDFCILPDSVVVAHDGFKLHVSNGMYANTKTAPNWVINVPEKVAPIRINGHTYGTASVTTDTLRIYAANCRNPVIVADVDWKNNIVSFKNDGGQMELEYAAEKLAGDPKVMRVISNMPDEIIEKRLLALWNFFASKAVDNDYFCDDVKPVFIEEALKSLFPPAVQRTAIPTITF